MKKIKIAVVSHDSFWPLKGGGGLRVFWVMKKLVERGHQVTVIAPFNDPVSFKEQFPSIKIRNLGKYSRFDKGKEIKYATLSLKVLLNLLTTPFDGIYAHNIVAAFPSYLASRIKHKPLIFDMDDILTGLSKNDLVKKYGGKLEFFVAKKSDCLITMSESLKKEIQKTMSDKKIYVVVHGVDLDHFFPRRAEKEDKIIYIGGIEPHDGTLLIPEVAKDILQKYPNIKFQIIGEGSMLNKLVEEVIKHNLFKNFEFFNWVNNEDIPKFLSKAKIGIITHYKTQATDICLVLKGLEYMAMGLPVVAPDLSGMREEFGDNQRGLLFEPGNPRDLSKKILHLLRHKALRYDLGRAGRNFVRKNCDWRNNAEEIVKISENCIIKYKKQ